MESLPQQEGTPPNLRQTILDILADKKEISGKPTQTNAEIIIEDLPLIETPEIRQNITLLQNLNGQKGADLRRLMGGATPEARHLRELQAWSLRVAKGEAVGTEILIAPPPQGMGNLNGEGLYERISFLEKNPDLDRGAYNAVLFRKTAEAIGTRTEKWVDLVDPLFADPKKIKRLIETVGFIPEELYTKKKFKNVPPEKIVAGIESLRALESTPHRNEALHERAKAINHLFISRRAEGIRGKERQNITLDSNGLFINLINFHTHLPYALVRDETLAELERGNWLTRESLDEIRIQRAAANNEPDSVEELRRRQSGDFNNLFGNDKGSGDVRYWVDISYKIRKAVCEERAILPDVWIERHTSSEELSKLMRLAEEITAEISGEITAREIMLLSGRKISEIAREEYEVRSKMLRHPAYYNVIKIVRHFLRQTSSHNNSETATFRGQYKKSPGGDQHSFIEMLHKGELARVLINEEKHIPPTLRLNLEALPLFEREEYDNLENALRVYNSFSVSLGWIKRTRLTQTHHPNFLQYAENCLHFVLNNVSKKYREAAALFELLKKDPEQNSAFIALMDEAETEYKAFFYKNIGSQKKFVEEFSPEVTRKEVLFGNDFVEGAKGRCPKGYDPKLSTIPFSIRVVTIGYKLDDPSETIPFHVEESCLDALRIDRNRPLINVIGGCKHLDKEENPLELFGHAVMETAHAHKANVGVPGTQSGIGTVFGMENIRYKEKYGHLPYAEQAHFFSINPGGSVYFPGNPFLRTDTNGSVYANTTVDSIATPVPAEWNKKGLEKYASKYRTHIAYMEALYGRMSIGQKNVTVVGNGGLYSIMEINESLKRDAGLLLVSNTGRFAEAAALLLPHAGRVLSSENKGREILRILTGNMEANTLEEFCQKDFGKEETPENDDYAVYRDFFYTFLVLAQEKKEKIKVTTLDSLRDDLDRLLKK